MMDIDKIPGVNENIASDIGGDHAETLVRRWRQQFPDADLSVLALRFRFRRLSDLFALSALRELQSERIGLEEFSLLAILFRGPDEKMVVSAAVAHGLLSPTGNNSQRIKRLESLGLLRRSRDPDDGRRGLISLTETGRRLVVDFAQHEYIDRPGPLGFSALDDDEKRTLNLLLQKILLSLGDAADLPR